jgi:hypothetical protein
VPYVALKPLIKASRRPDEPRFESPPGPGQQSLLEGPCDLTAPHRAADTPGTMSLPDVAETILALEHEVLTAIFRADKARMRELMEPDGIGVDAGFATATQASLIDGIHALEGASWHLEDPLVIPAGNNAFVVSYDLHQQGTFGGAPIPPCVHASTVWARRGAHWKAMYHQETEVRSAP